MKTFMLLVIFNVAGQMAKAQTPGGSILLVEIENQTVYVLDCPNSQLASSTTRLDRANPKTFESAVNFGDIVSVNGTSVKGSVFESITATTSSPTPPPGGVISD